MKFSKIIAIEYETYACAWYNLCQYTTDPDVLKATGIPGQW